MARIAIHGFGRIGRSLMKVALKNDLFVPVSISDIKDLPTLAALFEVTSTTAAGLRKSPPKIAASSSAAARSRSST